MRWRDHYSLSTQFLAAAAVVLCLSMAVLGTWVTHRITRSVLVTSGLGGSDLMVSILEAEVQDLLPDGSIPAENQKRLDQLLVSTPVTKRIVSVKIWKPDGTVIYANMAKGVIGQRFASTDVTTAAGGQIVAEFKDMVSEESAYEQSLGKSLIEVYAPLYKTGTRSVVAVGEIYEDAKDLDIQLRSSRRLTWIVVCLTTLLMLSFLYLIVRRGSYTIALQRAELRERMAEAQNMASQNERLRLDANEANEELLGRIGSDIHDGPIQALTLARLRIDDIADIWADNRQGTAQVFRYLEEAAATLGASIEELRHLSTGLVLPGLDELSPRQLVELACARHESTTATQVALDLGDLPQALSAAMKICVYRIIQESLTNAFRHAGGVGQRVAAMIRNNRIELQISDQGGQVTARAVHQASHTKLGHRGIRNRVQAFGGTLSIERTEKGTDVRVSLPLDMGGV